MPELLLAYRMIYLRIRHGERKTSFLRKNLPKDTHYYDLSVLLTSE